MTEREPEPTPGAGPILLAAFVALLAGAGALAVVISLASDVLGG